MLKDRQLMLVMPDGPAEDPQTVEYRRRTEEMIHEITAISKSLLEGSHIHEVAFFNLFFPLLTIF